jgi:gamma-glutamyltranspeptidase / glutathione hydrolase
MVAAPDQLAAEAGVAALRAGGTAADAAISASAVIAVTAPHMCGPGGDLWAMVHPGPAASPEALNAAGRAGSGADPDRLRAEGQRAMPFDGDIRSVPVPGCVDGWCALHARHGRLAFADLLAPAIELARDGFPCSPLLALMLPEVWRTVAGADDVVVTGDLRRGARVRRPALARTLSDVATGGRDAFYRGAFGTGLLALGAGEYETSDLETPLADWVEPLALDAWDHRLWTTPPSSQGYLALAGVWIATQLPLPDDPEDPSWAHLLVESALAAGHDRRDVLFEHADGHALLDHGRLAPRAAEIRPDRCRGWLEPMSRAGDTIFLCAVDADRRGVSLIQSNASGFGAGLVVRDTGVFLHNRGIGFSLAPGHPAEYGPRRRPPSTLSPTLVTGAGGELRAVAGTMGGDSQPQILLQVLTRLLAHTEGAGRAVGSPRWVLANPGGRGFDTWEAGDRVTVLVEADAPSSWASGLADRGHQVQVTDPWVSVAAYGHAHVIDLERDGDGGSMLAGASDPRVSVGGAVGY